MAVRVSPAACSPTEGPKVMEGPHWCPAPGSPAKRGSQRPLEGSQTVPLPTSRHRVQGVSAPG